LRFLEAAYRSEQISTLGYAAFDLPVTTELMDSRVVTGTLARPCSPLTRGLE